MPAMEVSDVEELEGAVTERLDAGHYTYVRVGEDWAVVFGRLEAKAGDPIALRVQGIKNDFHSRKLGRDFERLYFATRRDPT